MLGIFFDFFDGFAARLLKVSSELGKQLDSLADMVTSGVVPGIVMYQLLVKASNQNSFATTFIEKGNIATWDFYDVQLLPFVAFLLPIAAAYRLAKFNLDERQSTTFFGLPTPAMSIFVISLPLILIYSDFEPAHYVIESVYWLLFITIFLSVIMNIDIALFSLKFKNFSFKNNWIEVVFVLLTFIALLLFKIVAIPLLIVFYILLSIIKR